MPVIRYDTNVKANFCQFEIRPIWRWSCFEKCVSIVDNNYLEFRSWVIFVTEMWSAVIQRLKEYLTQHWTKMFVLCIWISVIVLYWRASQSVAPTAAKKVELLASWFRTDGFGPLIFLILYTVQPLVFFPTFIMTIVSGMLYGPIGGMAISVVGLNSAASVSYAAARLVGGEKPRTLNLNKYLEKSLNSLRTHTFETLLTLHLLYMPFDLLNYAAGIMRLNWRQFAIATAIGTIPSGISYVLLGNSLGSVDALALGRPNINFQHLFLSLCISLGAILTAQYVKRTRSLNKTAS